MAGLLNIYDLGEIPPASKITSPNDLQKYKTNNKRNTNRTIWNLEVLHIAGVLHNGAKCLENLV